MVMAKSSSLGSWCSATELRPHGASIRSYASVILFFRAWAP